MPPMPINQYIDALRRSYRALDATERTYYSILEALIESLGPRVDAVCEPRRIACGAPDFHVKSRDLIVGHIEAKDLGASLDDAEKSEQIEDRYRPTLPNLILTNFLEFRWYLNGEFRLSARLGRVEDGHMIKATREGRVAVLDLLKGFLARDPQGAQDARDLAVRLARYAHEIRNAIVNGFALNHVSADLTDLRDAVKKELIPDLTTEAFADLFAQTLAYGFFAAWCNHPTGKRFQRLGAAHEIPKTNPLLRDIFEMITGNALDDEPFVGYVDDLVQLLDRTDKADVMEDFARKTGRADPVVHFYETFLKEYDPKVRELRGVYYTPEPVVSYMVRSVDHLLKTRFGLPKGLADTAQAEYEVKDENGEKLAKTGPRVLILDPACGTGTFLFEIVNHIRDEFIRKGQSGAWSSYVREHLLPRLFGFELLMAPYAMAHLKLGLQLAGQDLGGGTGSQPVDGGTGSQPVDGGTGSQPADGGTGSQPVDGGTGSQPVTNPFAYDFAGDERLGIYLTNTLEEAARKAETLFGPMRVITQEANAAAEIKRDKPIMVVIGNPPYSGHSANRSWERKNGKRVPTFIGRLLQDYYQVDGRPLGEKNPKWLQDDYVKFIRFGQWRIEQSGGGILALITNHSYLDNPTFRGMRQQLMQAFTDIYLLDLHGNSRKKEVCPDGSKDENVFDIQQGVAIAIFVKTPGIGGTGSQPVEGLADRVSAPPTARVWHADLWGLRESKEADLSAQTCETVQWQEAEPRSPAYVFIPQDGPGLAEYEEATLVPECFLLYASTVTTARNRFSMAYERETLASRLQDLCDETLSDDAIRERYGLKDVSYWKLADARQQLAGVSPTAALIEPYCYRPFDLRFVAYHESVCERPRADVMRHMVKPNVALLTHRPQSPGSFSYVYCTRLIGDQCVAANKSGGGGNSYQFPLYQYPQGTHAISVDEMVETTVRHLAESGADAAAQQHLAATIRRLFPASEYPRWPNLDPFLLADLEDRLGIRFVYGGTGSQPVIHPKTTGQHLTITRRKLPHWQLGGSTYFITFRLQHPSGTGSQPVAPLSRDERDIVKHDILHWHAKRWAVHALTVMPHHVHILATPLEESPGHWFSLSKILHSVKFGSALKINRLRGRRGSLWQSESFDRIVRDDKEFDQKALYILNNAVKADLTEDAWEYDGFWCEEMHDRLGACPTENGYPPGRGNLENTFGPEDVFNYIYAILHSPTYRERYAEFLKRDFPRIPFTSDRELFAKLTEKGAALVAYHLLESEDLAAVAQPLSGEGDNRVERVGYDGKDHRVYINKTQFFPNVPSDVWSFRVGGYQVCEKWLKDRKGRTLTYDEQEHYTKVTVALRETIRLMREIDEAIPSWPIT